MFEYSQLSLVINHQNSGWPPPKEKGIQSICIPLQISTIKQRLPDLVSGLLEQSSQLSDGEHTVFGAIHHRPPTERLATGVVEVI